MTTTTTAAKISIEIAGQTTLLEVFLALYLYSFARGPVEDTALGRTMHPNHDGMGGQVVTRNHKRRNE